MADKDASVLERLAEEFRLRGDLGASNEDVRMWLRMIEEADADLPAFGTQLRFAVRTIKGMWRAYRGR